MKRLISISFKTKAKISIPKETQREILQLIIETPQIRKWLGEPPEKWDNEYYEKKHRINQIVRETYIALRKKINETD